MFDYLVDHHKVMKVETAGDCYIVAGGIMGTDGEGFQQVRLCAFACIRPTHRSPLTTLSHNSCPLLQVQDGQDAADCAQRVMAFAMDMMRCSKEVR